MKKTLITIFSLLLILLAAIAILPSVIDWNQYKQDITAKAKQATGRDIVINGDIKLRILPSPSITLNDVTVSNPDGFASKASSFASVEKVKVDAALKPLFQKQLRITGVSVVKPQINLQKNGDKTNWDFSKPDAGEETSEVVSSSKNKFTPELSFDEVEISQGSLSFQEGQGDPVQIDPINAKIKGDSLQGPFTVSGDLVYNKIPAIFDVNTGTFSDTKATEVKAKLSIDKSNALIDVTASIGGDAKNTKSKINLNITDLEKLIANLKGGQAPSLPDFLNKKIKASGDLIQSDDGINLDNLEVALGSMNVKGNATYSNDKKIGVSLATNTIDLRQSKTQNSPEGAKVTGNQTYKQALDGLFQTASGFIGTSLPSNLTAGFALRVKKLITEQNITVENVDVSAVIDANGVKVSNASVDLPGQAQLAITASLPVKNQKISQINSQLSFKAQKTDDALRAFGVSTLPSGFSPLNAQAKIAITQESLSLTDTTLKFAKNDLSGLTLNYTPKAPTPLAFKISGGDLDFNTLLQEKNATSDQATNQETTKQTTPLGLPKEISQKLTGLKADLNVKLNQIIYGDNLARNITFNSKIDGEKIIITEASIGDLGDLNSLNLKIAGSVGNLSPFDAIDLTMSANSDNLSRTLWAFGNKNAGDIGKTSFTGTIKGSQENVAIKANGKIDQGSVSIDGSLKNLATTPSLSGEIKAQHPETSVVLKNFANMDVKNSKMGPFSLSAKLLTSQGKFQTDDLMVNMGDQGTISGLVNYDKTGTTGVINVDLNADLLPLGNLTGAKTNRVGGGQGATAAPKTWSQKPIDLAMLRNTSGVIKVNVKKLTYDAFVFNNFSLLANVKDNTLTLQNLAANMFDGSFAVTGALKAAPVGQNHNGQFTLDINKANVEKVFTALGSKAFGGGLLTLKQSLKFSGPHQLGIVKSLNGEGNLTVENGSFNGLDLDSLATKIDRPNSPSDFMAIIQQAKAGGTSSFETIEAPILIENGVITSDNIIVKSQKSQIDLGGFVNLPSQNLKLDGEIKFTEQRNLPGLGLEISGPLYAPKKQLKTDNILRFYTQKATQELGQKALDKLFGKEPANDNTGNTTPDTSSDPAIETQSNLGSTDGTTQNNEQPATQPQQPQDVEDVLKQQGEQLLRGLLGGQ